MVTDVNPKDRIVRIDDVRYRIVAGRTGAYNVIRERDAAIVADLCWMKTDAPEPQLFASPVGHAIPHALANRIAEMAKTSRIVKPPP